MKITKKKKLKKGVSRRDFLKYTGATVAGLGAGMNVVGCDTDENRLPLCGKTIDRHGSLITVSRIDPLLSYGGDYVLNADGTATPIVESVLDRLASFIQSGETDMAIWDDIVHRINYTYEAFDDVLLPILGSNMAGKDNITSTGKKIQKHVNGQHNSPPKKLLFKPNLVTPGVFEFGGNGSISKNDYGMEGSGASSCTHWVVLAALMRWFHDNLDISYHQMAIGEAATSTRVFRDLYHNIYSSYWGFPYTAEAVYEGRVTNPEDGQAIFYGGYPIYYVRKYLATTHDPLHTDDPMKGHLQSVFGPYTPPGQAVDQLPYYDLGNAEAHTPDARGREIAVPHGACYQSVVIHKAVIGDPDDLDNYPGAVLINVPKLKVHSVCLLTNAIKNFGIGLWPAQSGLDSDPNTPDYMYGFPSTEHMHEGCSISPSPNFKVGIYHSRYSKGAKFGCDGGFDATTRPEFPNDGIKGTMVDINLAVMAQKKLVPYILHVTDAISATNLFHGGGGAGYTNNEGLLLVSEDPVSLDVFGARYLYKSVPKDTVPDHPFAIWNPVGDVRYDASSSSIISSEGDYEWPVENTYLFSYSEARGLGTQTYHVKGRDRTVEEGNFLLVSQQGHFCRVIIDNDMDPKNQDMAIRAGRFTLEEIITKPQYAQYGLPVHYWSQEVGLLPLQRTWFKLAQAADKLTFDRVGYNPGYEARIKALDTNNDSRLIFAEEANDVDVIFGCTAVGYSILSMGQVDRGYAHLSLKSMKYSRAEWNEYGTSCNDSTAMIYAKEMASTPMPPDTMDPFLTVPWGLDENGVAHWPSVQFAAYVSDMAYLKEAYERATNYATPNGLTFQLYAPATLPYFPFVPTPFASIGPYIESTDDPQLVCTVKFFDADKNEVAQW